MGYSARYHAMSLISVFLALGIGILLGVGFGDAVVSDTQRDLQKSLRGDLSAAREARNQAKAEVSRQKEFAAAVYPALAEGRLSGARVALIGLGGIPKDLSGDVKDALEPSGGSLTEVAVFPDPLSRGSLAEGLSDSRFAKLATDDGILSSFGESVGRQLVDGGRLLRRLRSRLFERVSGRIGNVDAVIVVRNRELKPDPDDRKAFDRFERGVLRGIVKTEHPAVGVERSQTEHSSISMMQQANLSTVDNIDSFAGKLALVYALGGTEGDFGTRGTADRLLPELLGSSGGP